jgi:glyoxylase-like metal-dependent hydrolase (beta-lactamase superfamily II)
MTAISLNNYLVFVDSTLYPYHARTFRKLVEKKCNLKAKYLFLTHKHGDHVLANAAFKDIGTISAEILKQNMIDNLKADWTGK